MNTVIANRMVENYFRFMRNWDTDAKKDLINKLTVSLNMKSKDFSDFSSCFGAWEDSRSAEEIAADIRNDRFNQKDIEGF